MAETVITPRDSGTEVSDEEHEEGEISDEEPPAFLPEEPEAKVEEGGEAVEELEVEREDPDQEKEVPLLHRRVSLDDLMRLGEQSTESRIRSNFYRHEGTGDGKSDDDGHERNAWGDDKSSWRRDGTPFTPNGAYGANLYNFAWAQAVSGRPSFPSAGSPKSDKTPGSSPAFGDWAAENVTRDFSREMEICRRGGRSSDERDDLSPIDKGRVPVSQRLGRMRSVEKETWGASERRLRGRSRVGRLDKEEDEDDDLREFEEDNRRKRSESQSPNGRLDEITESGRSSSEATVHMPSDENDGEREDGELEEGEIELPAESSSPPKETPDVSRQSIKYDAETSDYRSGKDKYPVKLDARSMPKPYSRSQTDDYSSRKGRQAKSEEYERERRLASASNLVKNVTVKDAQKSFIDVCERLYKALRMLDELHTARPNAQQEGRLDAPPREVTALARQAFAGIRAVYAVRNTASGREQERDKNMFPRLLELANGYCQKLFTAKQTRELEVMMQTMATAGRFARDAAEKPQYPREQQFLSITKKSKEKDGKQRDPLITSFPTTKQQNLTEVKDLNVAGRILDFVDAKQAQEAAAIAAAALAYAKSSAASRSNSLFGSAPSSRSGGSSVSSTGSWEWFTESTSHGHYPDEAANSVLAESGYTSSMSRYQQWSEGEHRASKPVQEGATENNLDIRTQRGNRQLGSSSLESMTLPAVYVKSGNSYGMLEEDWEELSPPGGGTSSYIAPGPLQLPGGKDESVVVKAWPPRQDVGSLPPYQKNVGVNSMYSRDRLPSPTPDEENEDDLVGMRQPFKEMQSMSTVTDSIKSASQPTLVVGKLNFHSLVNSDHNLFRSQSLDSPLSSKGSKVERGFSEFTMLPSPTRSPEADEPGISYSTAAKGNLKSRDPRRRLQNSSVDYDRDLNSRLNFDAKPGLKEASVARIDNSRKRHVPDAQDREDERLEKRQKFQGESNRPREFDQDTLHGTGGWLDDNPVPSAEEGPIAMEVDEEFSSAGMQDKKASELNAIVEERLIEYPQEVANSLDLMKKQNSELGLQNADISQRKMKPRDPRRLLIEGNGERGEMTLTGGDTVSTADLSKGIEVGPLVNSSAARATMDDETSASWKNRDNPQTTSQVIPLPNIAPHFIEKLTSLAGMVGTGPSTGGSTTQSKPLSQCAGSQICHFSGTIDLSSGEAQGMDTVIRPEVSAGVAQQVLDPQTQKIASLGTGPRKPKGSPGQWGASQVHPGLEKLLEELPEIERRAVQLERERRMEEQDRMFSAGKLCLVLDLDHTLLNSAKFSEIEPEWEHRLRAAEAAERSRTNREPLERRELYRFPHMSMWTKLRPGIWKFLARASQLFELHVYTMGNKVYATEMAKLLDPSGTLFEGRVISKGDDGDGDDLLPKSKDLDGVLGMESAVIIIDDSARVWPHHSQNLIVVERYMYFPCSRRQFGLAGPSLLEVGHDEREADGMIASVLSVVDRIHRNFFENQRLREVDVRDILAAEQRQVLAGCKVVFSRIFPVGEAQPHLHPLWRTAEQFGAICTTKIDDEVTHIVAISPGTDKVNWALSTGRYVVRPAWLEASTILYRRANERDFFVPPQPQ